MDWALVIPSAGLLILAATEVFHLIWRGPTEYLSEVASAAWAVKGLTDSEREALGIYLPSYGLKLVSNDIAVIFSGNATHEDLLRFMDDSQKSQVSPLRNWQLKNEPEIWKDIANRLIEDGLVQKDSAAGSHSLLWINNGYEYMLNKWYHPTRRKFYPPIPNLNEARDV